MIQTHTTFHGKTIPLNEIEHQHLSNIIWYNTIVLDYPVESCCEFLAELRTRYNGQLLPYRPHVDFGYEMGVLRKKGMLVLDKVDPKRIIIFGEGREVGEIQCTTIDQRHQILFPYQAQIDSELNIPAQPSIDAPMEQLITQMKSVDKFTVPFEELRSIYKSDKDSRPAFKKYFKQALVGIDEEIKREELATKRDEAIRLAEEKRKKEEEDSKPLFEVGILLRRRNHPLNVYTVQRNGNSYGIFNITHGQWWGNTVPVNNMRLLSVKTGKCLKKFVSKGEFLTMCGSHNPDNFYAFDEANDLIKK